MTLGSAGIAPASPSIGFRVPPSIIETLIGIGMTAPATDRSTITTTRRSGTEIDVSFGRAAPHAVEPRSAYGESITADGKPWRGALLLAALGVVYGDIGTSPIYTFRECLKAGSDGEAVLGLLSLVFWSLT